MSTGSLPWRVAFMQSSAAQWWRSRPVLAFLTPSSCHFFLFFDSTCCCSIRSAPLDYDTLNLI